MSVNSGIGLARFVSISKGIAIASLCLCIGLMFLPNGVWSDQPDTTVEKLIKQFKGEAYYWNQWGEKPGLLDRFTIRNFEVTSKITAATMLGELEPKATEAVPVLLEALESGPNDIDTGDGVLPYRSTIAIALGRIGDARAIGPLIEKLKVKEGATSGPGRVVRISDTDFPVGIAHPAVVEALGMFGTQAKEAVPHLKARWSDAQQYDRGLAKLIERTLPQIEQED